MLSTELHDMTMAPPWLALMYEIEQTVARSRSRNANATPSPTDASYEELLNSLTFDELLGVLLQASDVLMSPWSSNAAARLQELTDMAHSWHPGARFIMERFGDRLLAPFGRGAQTDWIVNDGTTAHPLPDNHHDIYDNGELPSPSTSTVGPLPPALLALLVDIWELPLPGHWTAITPPLNLRIFEINQPSHWVSLVNLFPRVIAHPRYGWELKYALERGHLQEPFTYLAPDWAAAAQHYDAIHLSWAGFLTSEGRLVAQAGNVYMLRHWHSERTLWLGSLTDSDSGPAR